MWPWGHLAVGYVAYSLLERLRGREVGGQSALVLAVSSQLPDLVDKPLAWVFDVTPTGFGVAHSVFVAIPLGVLALVASERRDAGAVGRAIVVGWWSHLAADVLVAVIGERHYTTERVLWPVVTIDDPERVVDVLQRLTNYYGAFVDRVQATDNVLLVVLYLAPVPLAFLLWLADGVPVAREIWQRVRSA